MTVAFAQSRVEIDASRNLVTIDADQADLAIVLHELALLGEFKLWMPQNLPLSRISLRVENQPLKDALRKLLVGTSYIMVNDANDAVSAIYFLPAGDGQPTDLLSPDLGGIEGRQVGDQAQSQALIENFYKMLGDLTDMNSESILLAIPEGASNPADAMVIDGFVDELQQLLSTLPEILDQPDANTHRR